MSATLSIVTICRNDKEELKKTIYSVEALENNIKQYVEHIIIDGASNDGTLEFLKSLRFSHLLWASEVDSGISDAFNKGVERSCGKYIMIINAGDICEPHDMSRLVDLLSSTKKNGIIFTSVNIFSGSVVKKISPNINNLIKKVSVFHCGMVVDRGTYKLVGEYSHKFKLAMDYEWILRAISNRVDLSQIPELCPTSMNASGVSNKQIFRAKYEVFKVHWKYTGKLYAVTEYFRSVVFGLLRVIYEGYKKDTYIR